MLANKLSRLALVARPLSTSQPRCFKFKLTEEVIRDFEAKQRALPPEPVPAKAQFTEKSPLIMGRVSSGRYRNVIKVGVPKYRLNEFLLLYLHDMDHISVYDELGCKPGDFVLIRRQPVDEEVEHKVERVVYEDGRYIDPLTKRRSLGYYYDDEIEELEKIKVET